MRTSNRSSFTRLLCRFYELIESQPKSGFLDQDSFKFTGNALIVVGTILVLTSYWKLGYTGTFLG